MNSQQAKILAALKAGRKLTPIDALREFGCFRLGGRICELRQAGHSIETDMVEEDGKWFARYRLVT